MIKLVILMEVKQDGMVVFVSVIGTAESVYEKIGGHIPKSWKKLMKVKMKIKRKIPKENLE